MTKGLVTNGLHRPLKMATTVCEGEIRVSDSSKNLKGFRFSNYVTMIPTRFQCRMLNFSAIFLVASPFFNTRKKNSLWYVTSNWYSKGNELFQIVWFTCKIDPIPLFELLVAVTVIVV